MIQMIQTDFVNSLQWNNVKPSLSYLCIISEYFRIIFD